jgi:hypothetical protein
MYLVGRMQFFNIRSGGNTELVEITMCIIIIIIIIIGHHWYAEYLQVYLKQTIFTWFILLQLFCGFNLWHV